MPKLLFKIVSTGAAFKELGFLILSNLLSFL